MLNYVEYGKENKYDDDIFCLNEKVCVMQGS